MTDRLFRQPFMSPTAVAACDSRASVTAMLDFEQALVAAAEAAGEAPAGSHAEISTSLRPELFDIEALAAATPDGGNVAIAFVKQAKACLPSHLRGVFHQGATSQDVIDTTLMLLARPRLARCLGLLEEMLDGAAAVMQHYRGTPMAGRTLTQQALPITFGAKMAGWLAGLLSGRQRLAAIHDHGLMLQLGGPVGVHHGMADGLSRMADVADRLGLACPLLPWHTDRQPVLALIDAVGALAAAADKIATDIAFMAQTEVGELREPAATGAGRSSSMPHKANPVGSTRIRAATRAIYGAVNVIHHAAAQPHERAFGEWHAEWAPLLDALCYLEGVLETLSPLICQPEVDTAAMARNLALPAGANLAAPSQAWLAPVLGADQARDIIQACVAQARETGRDYGTVVAEHPDVAARWAVEDTRAALSPGAYIGSSIAQVDRVADALRTRQR